MKRIKYIVSFLFAFLMFVPFVFGAENVVIKSVKLEDKSPAAEELHEATFNGLNVNFDVKFVEVDDYVKYKIVLKNNSKKEYDVELSDLTNEHMEYKYDVGKNVTIKANSELTINLTITYKTAVTPEELQDGAYVENKEFTISLSGEDNPKTGDINIAIIILLLIIVFGFLYYKVDSKQTKLSFVILLGIVLIPLTIYAAEKLTVKINSKVTISEDIKMYIKYYGTCDYENPSGSDTFEGKTFEYETTPEGACIITLHGKQGDTVGELLVSYDWMDDSGGDPHLYFDEWGNTVVSATDKVVNAHMYYEILMSKIIINNKEYDVINGMTFEDWLLSPFNTDNIAVDDASNFSCETGGIYLEYKGYVDNGNEIPTVKSSMNNLVPYDIPMCMNCIFEISTIDPAEDGVCEYGAITINNKQYRFIEGMDWEFWLHSKYNTDHLGIIDYSETAHGTAIISSQQYSFISHDVPIVAGEYTIDIRDELPKKGK